MVCFKENIISEIPLENKAYETTNQTPRNTTTFTYCRDERMHPSKVRNLKNKRRKNNRRMDRDHPGDLTNSHHEIRHKHELLRKHQYHPDLGDLHHDRNHDCLTKLRSNQHI